MKIEIIRVEKTDECCRGVMLLDGACFGTTLERPDLGNAENVSCIPAGAYKAKVVNSPHNGRCVELIDVPNRTHIQIHVGNTAVDTTGCILAGSGYGDFGAAKAVTGSRMALDKLLRRLIGVADITVEIREV